MHLFPQPFFRPFLFFLPQFPICFITFASNFRCNLPRTFKRKTWNGFVPSLKLIFSQLGQCGETVVLNIMNDLVSQATGINLIIQLLFLFQLWLADRCYCSLSNANGQVKLWKQNRSHRKSSST